MLTVLVTVQAYVQPYRRRLWNVLEVALSLNVIVLLLIRNTDDIESPLQVLGKAESQASNQRRIFLCCVCSGVLAGVRAGWS